MKGLCHECWESNCILTLDEGVPKCAKCYEIGLFSRNK